MTPNVHRLGLFLTALLTLIGLSTASAVAHEEINPKSAVVGQPTFFQLSAANEKKAGLTKITLHAPDGLPFGATTRSPNGWHAEVSETTITWSGGTVAPDQFDSWGFEIEGADQAKTYTYKADLGFADGTTDSVDVPITAVASAATPPTSTETAPKTATKPSDGTARVVAGIALLLSLVALGLALARRSGGAAQTSGDGAGSEASADW
jgi:uncharacterized protein YcnI